MIYSGFKQQIILVWYQCCVHVNEAICHFRPQKSGHCPSMCNFAEPAEVCTSWRQWTITQQAMWQTQRSDAGAIWYKAKKGL